MRSKNFEVAILLVLMISLNSMAFDTSNEENLCVSLGFKKKSPGFGNCVLELLDRKKEPLILLSEDDQTCHGYGFRPGSVEFSSCRQQIDISRQNLQEITKSREELEQFKREQESARRRAAASQALDLNRFRQDQESTRQREASERQARELWRANQKAIDESWRRP
jgi:hypothetical protein